VVLSLFGDPGKFDLDDGGKGQSGFRHGWEFCQLSRVQGEANDGRISAWGGGVSVRDRGVES
jgi:hypothetical protein